MRILTSSDGPGVAPSSLVRRSAYGGTSPYNGDRIDRADTGLTSSSPGSGADPKWVDGVPRPERLMFAWDTETADQDWATNAAGAGSGVSFAAEAVNQGLLSCATGTTTTGRASRALTTGTGWVVFSSLSNVQYYHAKFRVPTLTDGTNTFSVALGFHDVNTADDAVDGAYLRLGSGDSGVMQAVTSSNSTRTTTTTSVTITANTYYLLEIRVTQDTAADFWLYQEGNARPSTPTVNITTNIPSGTTRGTACRAGIIKSAGTTSRTLDVAYHMYFMDRTSA